MVEELLADLANLRFSWIDKAACGAVCKVRLVVLKSYESFTFGGGVNPVIEVQFLSDGFGSCFYGVSYTRGHFLVVLSDVFCKSSVYDCVSIL